MNIPLMDLEEIKKQLMVLHQAIMALELQYRLEAVDFLSDCCNDLRIKTFTYQDVGADHVLNLTMSHKEYMPFCGPFRPDDRFDEIQVPAFINPAPFPIAADVPQYDYGVLDCPLDIDDMNKSLEANWEQPSKEWESKSSQNESANPVNLVMPVKDKDSVSKKSRRKQMFTRKSVRRKNISSSSSVNVDLLAKKTKHIDEPSMPAPIVAEEKVANAAGPGSMSCRKCHQQFNDQFQLSKHKCKSKKQFVCKVCNKKFRFQTHYLQHLAGHKQNDCKYCSKKFSSKSNLRNHLKRDHRDIKDENEAIPCKFCPMTFSRLHRLYNHYQLHHSKGKFVCTVCGIFLASKDKHKEHMSGHDNDKKWKCEICDKKFFSKNMLANHLKIHNSGIYKCLTCQRTVASKLELAAHKRKKHEVVGLEPRFECNTCHKLFPKKWRLERHVSSHSAIKPHRCTHCDKLFGTPSALAKHQARNIHFNKVKEDAPESKYEKIYQDYLICETCGKQYKTHCQLNSHLQIHVTTYACDMCRAEFSLKSNLRRHMKSHSVGKQAVCEFCGDSFAKIAGLREHTSIKHSDVRLVQCPSCPKKFKRRSELNRHLRIHSTARPYVCFCGRSYKQSAHLKTHQNCVHSRNTQVISNQPDHTPNPLLSIGHFDDRDYRLQEAVVNYAEGISYEAVGFGEQPVSVSPAVDLSMVSMAEPEAKQADATMPLVNLSERIVQEYLLNLP